MVKLPYVVAIVERQGVKTPVTVFEHEVEVLNAVHGGNVEIDESAVPPVESAEIDPSEEFDRLQNLYCRGEVNPVVEALGQRRDFVARFEAADEAEAPRRGRKPKAEAAE